MSSLGIVGLVSGPTPKPAKGEIGERIHLARGRMPLALIARRIRERFDDLKPTTGTISRYASGEQEPSARYAAAIADVLGVRAEWLVLGTGPRERTEVPDTSIHAFLARFNEMPGLRDAVLRSDPRTKTWSVATVLRAVERVAALSEHGTQAPKGGWEALLDDIERGALDVEPDASHAAQVVDDIEGEGSEP